MIQIVGPEDPLLEQVFSRHPAGREEALNRVKEILAEVKAGGDAALCACTARFDGVTLTAAELKVSREEMAAAREQVNAHFLTALEMAVKNITAYHRRQLSGSWMEPDARGMLLGQLVRPLHRVGVYVPGGRAAYPSSVLMNALPARVAGVKEIVMVTPPGSDGKINPHVLVAAERAGITEIYRVGGAQAVAALAWGTESIRPVDKIVGPGNLYVTLAKQQVYGVVDIDMLAGPSEVLVVADETADPRFVAADMLSQAEHDPLSAALLLTPDAGLARAVQEELRRQLAGLSRREIAAAALRDHGAIVLTRDMEQALDLANRFAPEHLELLVRDPFRWLGRIRAAGAVFLGAFAPEPLGDYLAGPSHVLPTGGTARFYSPLGVDTFLKKTSVISCSREALLEMAPHITCLARLEGLDAHARSVEMRLEKPPTGPAAEPPPLNNAGRRSFNNRNNKNGHLPGLFTRDGLAQGSEEK
ncbi:histidinol dehydrogenase [Desulfofundulus thermobenzoicus]|uniref:Histidinol dehydrogenase n=1 Tax=Desulfofundulus thermobenzoicus TaxID=29376 RepID=A0A6N7IUY5_9FIRM|nr:histidinol dehydrogenase [Desulfofundulus thermobenzoicus]MQL53894.1 histidinol dehydrogenase [Desulfofundulus thermobenzoicus]HHW43967.1 histidinol dehydrogenase [Desulfotomaculum sp.]